jgi:hypothetical protein
MWPKLVEPQPVAGTAKLNETETLVAQAGKWGMEKGYFGILSGKQPPVAVLVREAAVRMFGDCEALHTRVAAELERAESECGKAEKTIATYRARYSAGGTRPEGSRLARLRTWIWDRRECRQACRALRREEPVRRRLHAELETAAQKLRASAEWRERVAVAMQVNFEYQEMRAAAARQEKEISHDDTSTRESRRLVIRRAN